MGSGRDALRQHIRRIREVGLLASQSAPLVASAVQREILDQLARGVGPDGKVWKATKSGTRPLQNAGAALTVRALADVVLIRLTGHHARHHLGAVKGGVKRLIIPTARIPDPLGRAITKVVTGEFRRVMSS